MRHPALPTARRVAVPAIVAALLLTGDAFAAGLDARRGGLVAWLVVGLVALLGVLVAAVAAPTAVNPRPHHQHILRLGAIGLDRVERQCSRISPLFVPPTMAREYTWDRLQVRLLNRLRCYG